LGERQADAARAARDDHRAAGEKAGLERIHFLHLVLRYQTLASRASSASMTISSVTGIGSLWMISPARHARRATTASFSRVTSAIPIWPSLVGRRTERQNSRTR